jgi:hypothetical protein
MEGMDPRDANIVDVSDKFSSDLDFGIQDTLTLGAKDLLNFLNEDPKDIKPIESSTTTQDSSTISPNQTTQKTDTPDVPESEKAKSELENFLMGNETAAEPAEVDTESQTSDTNTDDTEDDINPYSVIAKELFDAGIFTKEEEEGDVDITEGNQLFERFQVEKKKGAIEIIDNFLGRFGEDYREAFDAIYVKGVDPREYFTAQQSLESFKDMDLSEESNQKKVFVEFHKQLGLSDEQIEKRLQKAIDYADLEEDAKTFHEKLIEKEAQKIEQLEQQKELERQSKLRADQEYNQSLQKILQEKITNKEFDGIPVTPKIAQDAYSFMYHKKYRSPQGEELTEFDKFLIDLKKPENYELRVKIGLLAVNKFDLSKVKQAQVSKENTKAFAALDKSKITKQVRQEQKPQIKSFFD